MDYKLHNPATKRSVNPYTDNYTGFIWNGHHSSDFNCFIENTGHLTFEPAPDFSNSTVSPAFYDGALYTGTQTQSKKIQLNLVLYKVTLEDFNKALHWLDRKIVSSFLLDYDPDWRYQCKIASLGITEKYVDGYCIDQTHGSLQKRDLYICRLQVGFETIDIHNALATYTTALFPDDIDAISPIELTNVMHESLFFIMFDQQENIQRISKTGDDKEVIDWVPEQYIALLEKNNAENDSLLFLDYDEDIVFDNRVYEVWHERFVTQNYYMLPKELLYRKHQDMIPQYYIINNTSSASINFRIHLCNFTASSFVIYQYIPDLMEGSSTLLPICTVVLNLDLVDNMTLHYDSKTGAITVGNQMASAIINGNGDPLISYYNTVSNLAVSPYERMQILCSDNFDGQIILEYDLQQSVI